MEAKLEANRHKGDRDAWRREQKAYLRRRLLEEVAELFHEMDTNGVPGTASERKARIRSECADVANFAMMIADVAGDLKPKP
jgi:pentatricopeptide repeat protein